MAICDHDDELNFSVFILMFGTKLLHTDFFRLHRNVILQFSLSKFKEIVFNFHMKSYVSDINSPVMMGRQDKGFY